MKVLFINTSDAIGGAAVACSRLCDALARNGVEVKMLVRDKVTDNPLSVKVRGSKTKQMLDAISPQRSICKVAEQIGILPHVGYSWKRGWTISTAAYGTDVTQMKEFQEADVIHLHWTNQGMLSLDDLEAIFNSGKRIVLTLHDMWYFTSVCHYSYGCEKFVVGCHDCPCLSRPSHNDLSAKVFEKKIHVFENKEMTVISVSSWLERQAKSSRLLRDKQHCVIPNVISFDAFRLKDREDCRKRLGLPSDKVIIAFGAASLNVAIKNFPMFAEALTKLPDTEDIHVALYGGMKDSSILKLMKVPYTYLGFVKGAEELCDIYNAADISVSASLYETFGQTLVESQACGCLPVALATSGQTDIIDNHETGVLVPEVSAEELAWGIQWAINHRNEISRDSLRQSAMQRFSEKSIIEKLMKVYIE